MYIKHHVHKNGRKSLCGYRGVVEEISAKNANFCINLPKFQDTFLLICIMEWGWEPKKIRTGSHLFLHIFCNSCVYEDRNSKISDYAPSIIQNNMKLKGEKNLHHIRHFRTFLHIFWIHVIVKVATLKFQI